MVAVTRTDAEGGKEAATRLPTSILFVCGKNAIRSPMAELLARTLLPANIYIASAGVKRGERDPLSMLCSPRKACHSTIASHAA